MSQDKPLKPSCENVILLCCVIHEKIVKKTLRYSGTLSNVALTFSLIWTGNYLTFLTNDNLKFKYLGLYCREDLYHLK